MPFLPPHCDHSFLCWFWDTFLLFGFCSPFARVFVSLCLPTVFIVGRLHLPRFTYATIPLAVPPFPCITTMRLRTTYLLVLVPGGACHLPTWTYAHRLQFGLLYHHMPVPVPRYLPHDSHVSPPPPPPPACLYCSSCLPYCTVPLQCGRSAVPSNVTRATADYRA